MIHDATILAEIREHAARTGWTDDALLLDMAHEALCLRFRGMSPETRGNLRRRMARLWAARVSIMGPV